MRRLLGQMLPDLSAVVLGYLAKRGVERLRTRGFAIPDWADEALGTLVGVGVAAAARTLLLEKTEEHSA